jgi:hypothetical protein
MRKLKNGEKKMIPMNNRFNLYNYSLRRLAAKSHDRQVYRKKYFWFNLQDILNGNSEEWKRLESLNPSLKRFIYQAQSRYDHFSKIFQDRYNVSNEMVKKMYKMYVSYHPAYGAYMLGVGPYVGEKDADDRNKFGYFTMRFASTESESLMDLVSSNLKRNQNLKPIVEDLGLKDITSILSPEDFQIRVRHKVSPDWYKEGEDYEIIDINKDYLKNNKYSDENEVHKTVLGLGSKIELKPSGVFNLLRGYLMRKSESDRKLFEKIMLMVANKMNIHKDNIIKEFTTNKEFADAILGIYSNYNPIFKDVNKERLIGSQQEEKLKESTEQIRILNLMKEICEAASEINTVDINLLSEKLNNNRKIKKTMAKGYFDHETLSKWLQQIEKLRYKYDHNSRIIKKYNFSEMVEELDNILKDLSSNQGFENINIALQLASLRFIELPLEKIDPVTKANMDIEADVFDLSNEEDIITSDELTKLREKQGFSDINKEYDEELQDNEINDPNIKDIQEETEQVEETEFIDDIDFDQPSEKEIEDNNQIEEEEKEIIANTINSLIKISGKINPNEKKCLADINSIINKYKRFTS